MIANHSINDSRIIHDTPFIELAEFWLAQLLCVPLHIIEFIHINAISSIRHYVVDKWSRSVQRLRSHDHMTDLLDIMLCDSITELLAVLN